MADKRRFWAASTYPSEDFKIDEKDDRSKPLNKIHASSKAFRDQILQIANHSFVRTSSRQWAARLRFLEVDNCQASSNGETWLDAKDASAISSPISVTLQRKRDAATVPYVAISYCWNRSGASWFPSKKAPRVRIKQNDGSLVVSESDVILRALRFASCRGCRHIWMDQFCINQNDPVDKQDGIQAMDLVYQSSQHPVAILESFIDTQERMRAFSSLFTGEMVEESQLEDLDEALEILAEDAWFTRAWTLQEAVSSGLSMRVLIGCDRSLTKPKEFGFISGEIGTTLWDIQVAMITARNWMEEFLAAGSLEDEGVAISISNCADTIYNMMPDILPAGTAWSDSRPRASSDRQTCTAAEAVNALQERKNSVFSDRLGIIGNLCDFEIRLQSDVLEQKDFAFSTCVHTLAILNGDTSLLGRYSDPYCRSYLSRDGRNSVGFLSDPTDSAERSFGFSWGPVPWGSLRNIEYFDQHDEALKLEPATLSLEGLRVRGTLWSIDSSVELPELQIRFRERWNQELRAQEDRSVPITDTVERSDPIAKDFVSSLLETLYDRGLHGIALTLWNFFQPREGGSIHSRKSQPRYSFEEIFGPHRRLDICDIKHDLRVQILWIVHPSEAPEPSIMMVMLDNVCSTGRLLLGSPLGSGRMPQAFFESCKVGDIVFTPRTSLGDKICFESVYRTQAVSWRVTLADESEDGCRTVHCLGRRRGIYRMDNLKPAECCLE